MPTYTPAISLLPLILSLTPFANAIASGYTLTLANTYQGASFFDGWTYNASVIDPTNFGNIHYLSQSQAVAENLTFISPSNTAVVKVDNTTSGVGNATFGRDTVMLISNATISEGTLVLFDAVHIPFGCSVWPAFWTLDAATQTDAGGEIDIVEGANNVQFNQYTLHTTSGCSLTNDTSFPTANSKTLFTDCAGNAATGCAYQDARTSSYGSGFASNGGGVFAMLWDGDGIQMWFFPRSSIPNDVNSTNPQPWTWGNPSFALPFTGNCGPSFFKPQKLMLDIDICGALGVATFSQTCSGVCTDRVADPSNYDNAYFEINYIKTFTGAPTTLSIASLAPSSQGTTSSSSSPSSTTSTSSGSKSHGERSFGLGSVQIVMTALSLLGVGVGLMI